MWRQVLAISLLLACGIATFIMSTSAMQSLEMSRESYYRLYRFADVFVPLTRAPQQLAVRAANLPGVAQVQARIVQDALLDIPSMLEPASCRLVSIDDDPTSGLNRIFIRRGRLPNPAGRNEVIASEQFSDAHKLMPGDVLNVNMDGRQEALQVVGIGMSPEFIYAVQPGLMLTDNRRFGILWMPKRQMEAAFNMEGAFNSLAIELRPRASVSEVIFQVDRLVEAFGGRGAFGRKDQESHRRLADEMHQMRSMAYVTPSIFLSVAAFLSNIVLSRLVNQQKEQIATLRAFGYTRLELAIHYFKFLAVIVVIGATIGLGVGWRMSWWMIDVYAKFFRFPVVVYELATREALVAVAIALLAASLGGYSAVRRVFQLQPAVAMRPDPPHFLGGSILDRLGLGGWVSPVARMIVRRLEANPQSTLLSILGISMGLAVLVLGSFMGDTIAYVIDMQFGRSQRQDVTLTFNETLSAGVMHDVRHLPAVDLAEPFRTVPIRLRHGIRQYRLSLMGLEQFPYLYRVLDERQRPIQIVPDAGLTISRKLAELLDVGLGDELDVEILETKCAPRRVRVASIFLNYTEPCAYLYRHDLHRLVRESERLSGVFATIDSAKLPELYTAIKTTPAIAGILDNNAARKNFQELITENTRIMRLINAIFGSIIAFGVIYNAALITLAESGRDLATLRVIGFSRREVSGILLGELAILTFLAIPVGLPIGYGFSLLATLALDTDSHRFPLVVHRQTFAYATSVILVAALVSAMSVRRMSDRLDLIAVLKVKVA